VFEDGFQDMFERGFHDPVSHGRDTQRAFLVATGFVYPFAPRGARAVAPFTQLFLQPFQLLVQVTAELQNTGSQKIQKEACYPSCAHSSTGLRR